MTMKTSIKPLLCSTCFDCSSSNVAIQAERTSLDASPSESEAMLTENPDRGGNLREGTDIRIYLWR
jgi:hypothetical protein